MSRGKLRSVKKRVKNQVLKPIDYLIIGRQIGRVGHCGMCLGCLCYFDFCDWAQELKEHDYEKEKKAKKEMRLREVQGVGR